jgi:hypothetical protein
MSYSIYLSSDKSSLELRNEPLAVAFSLQRVVEACDTHQTVLNLLQSLQDPVLKSLTEQLRFYRYNPKAETVALNVLIQDVQEAMQQSTRKSRGRCVIF